MFDIFGRVSLPVCVQRKYVRSISNSKSLYSDEELVKLAASLLETKTLSLLKNSDLLKIRTYGEFTDKGYLMSSKLVFITDVGSELKFYIE